MGSSLGNICTRMTLSSFATLPWQSSSLQGGKHSGPNGVPTDMHLTLPSSALGQPTLGSRQQSTEHTPVVRLDTCSGTTQGNSATSLATGTTSQSNLITRPLPASPSQQPAIGEPLETPANQTLTNSTVHW